MPKNSWIRRSSDENEECEFLTHEGLSLISVSDVESLLKKALLSANLAENMCQIIGNSPKFSYCMMPFMSDVPNLYFRGLNLEIRGNECMEKQHSERLSNILDTCNMKKHHIVGWEFLLFCCGF